MTRVHLRTAQARLMLARNRRPNSRIPSNEVPALRTPPGQRFNSSARLTHGARNPSALETQDQVGRFKDVVVAYAAIRHWRSGDSWGSIQTKLGLPAGDLGWVRVVLVGSHPARRPVEQRCKSGGAVCDFEGASVEVGELPLPLRPGLCFLAVGATWVILHALPANVLLDPRTTNAQSTHLTLGPGTILVVSLQQLLLVAFGEELFFRGFLGGWLVRRLGFQAGNAIQATLLLLPHTLLLLVSSAFWPLLIVQWLMGWINGWVRTRTGSVGPGLVVHTVANTAALVLTI